MDLTADFVALGIGWFVVFLFSTTVHEAAHAFAALRLGDPTAYQGGQVTLNPLPHIRREPFGMILVPLLSYWLVGFMMGWASAPYDPNWADRHPRRAAWMALAGPVSNLVLVILSGLAIKVGMLLGALEPAAQLTFSRITDAVGEGPMEGVAAILSILFALNLLLFVFNLFPLPPMDGSAVLPLFMSEDAARKYQEFMRQPMFALLGIYIAWKLIGAVYWPILLVFIHLLYPGVSYGG